MKHSPKTPKPSERALTSRPPVGPHEPPRFDTTVKTEFLRRTIARSMTPKAERRVHGLRQMENLLARQEAGYLIGLQGMLLGSIAQAFPVSHSAMRRELRGLRATGLVEIAEQIELHFFIAPYRGSVPGQDA